MKGNMAYADRIIRFIVAALIIGLFMSGTITGFVSIGLLIIAGIFAVTSLISSCPLYSLLGFSSKKKTAEQA
jgi:hypothetical protein